MRELRLRREENAQDARGVDDEFLPEGQQGGGDTSTKVLGRKAAEKQRLAKGEKERERKCVCVCVCMRGKIAP